MIQVFCWYCEVVVDKFWLDMQRLADYFSTQCSLNPGSPGLESVTLATKANGFKCRELCVAIS